MIDPDALEQLNGEIAVIADHIARHRELIQQMTSDGKSVDALTSALTALFELYRQRVQARDSLHASLQNAAAQSEPVDR